MAIGEEDELSVGRIRGDRQRIGEADILAVDIVYGRPVLQCHHRMGVILQKHGDFTVRFCAQFVGVGPIECLDIATIRRCAVIL